MTMFYTLPEMPIAALAPWFGAKRNLADAIIRECGPHTAWWEPFCGSMAVTLAKPPATMETVNDLHGALINLARVVKDDDLSVRLFSRLTRTLLSEDLIREAGERLRQYVPSPELNLEWAADYFTASWGGRNGVAGTGSYKFGFCKRYTKNGGHAAKRFISAVESIPAWWQRLRNVTILNMDAFALLAKIEDAPGVVIYCDPPYIVKGAKYVHDFNDAAHGALAASLRRFKKTRVVVSYYDHPRLAELYPGWRVVPLKATKALVNQGMRDQGGAVVAPEVLLVNQE